MKKGAAKTQSEQAPLFLPPYSADESERVGKLRERRNAGRKGRRKVRKLGNRVPR